MQRGCTPRVRRLRKESLEAAPRISLERARIETEVYRQYEGRLSVPELRATALLAYMQRRELYLGDGELIVGEKGDAPQAAPTFPELCCHSLADMDVMNGRERISFAVTDADRTTQSREILPFWQGRTMRDRLLGTMTDEWKACYESGIFTEFMEQRGPGHTVGSENIFKKGFLEYKRDIAAALAAVNPGDPDAEDKLAELRAMSVCCDAVIALGDRYAALARERAAAEPDAEQRREWLALANVCDVVPRHRPQTFRQAIQMYWFVHLCVTTELNPWDAYSPGRLDQHLCPYYRAETEAGTLTRQDALELLECLWIKFNNQPAPPKVGITLKESSTYTDFANINTGGVAPDGSDGVNAVSFLILDCMDEMRLLQPSSNVQISSRSPDAFVRRACQIAREGWGQPAFYNTDAIVQELCNAGKTLADAYRGGASGCVETGAFGNEAYILTGYFNLPKILELTLHNGRDPRTGRQLGLRLGEAADFASFDALFDAYERQVRHFADIKIEGSNRIERLFAEHMPVPFLSILTNDCIASARDYNAGGARYNTSYLQGVGVGTVTDCLSAIRWHVFEKRTFSMQQLMQALADDFAGHAALRGQLLYHTPRYGNNDAYADALMQRVFAMYDRAVTGRPNTRGGMWRINLLPTTCHVYFGEVMGASADGRYAGKPVSEGISPVQGADTNGPTAVIRSCAKMRHCDTGGTLLNQKFTPSVIAGEKGLSALSALIRTYFSLGGHHIQFNVVDKQTLLAAQKDPEAYRDLIVRVAGYSDHFRNLSPALQEEIIARTEQAGF